jgi:D-glycero-D-manno-heptose 1,7-bisphosphate phosphatase
VIEEQGKIVAFLEKDAKSPGPGIINGGIYVLRREVLDLIHALPCSLEKDVFPVLVERREIRGLKFDGYFLDIGLPETLEQGRRELPNTRARPAAIFDKDALVNFADGDSSRPEAFRWTKGAVAAIRALNDRGYYVLVTGHRSGEARRLNAMMRERLAPAGAHVDRFTGEPGSGHVIEAMKEWPIVGERSFYVGVAGGDSEAARRAGISAHVFDGGDLARLVRSLLSQSA